MNTKSSGYNLLASDFVSYHDTNKGRRSIIRVTQETLAKKSGISREEIEKIGLNPEEKIGILAHDFMHLMMTKEVIGCTNSYKAPKQSLLINVVPTKGFLYYGETDGLSNGVKAYSPVYSIRVRRTGDGTAAGKNSNGYSVAVHGESLGNLNFDRLSW